MAAMEIAPLSPISTPCPSGVTLHVTPVVMGCPLLPLAVAVALCAVSPSTVTLFAESVTETSVTGSAGASLLFTRKVALLLAPP